MTLRRPFVVREALRCNGSKWCGAIAVSALSARCKHESRRAALQAFALRVAVQKEGECLDAGGTAVEERGRWEALSEDARCMLIMRMSRDHRAVTSRCGIEHRSAMQVENRAAMRDGKARREAEKCDAMLDASARCAIQRRDARCGSAVLDAVARWSIQQRRARFSSAVLDPAARHACDSPLQIAPGAAEGGDAATLRAAARMRRPAATPGAQQSLVPFPHFVGRFNACDPSAAHARGRACSAWPAPHPHAFRKPPIQPFAPPVRI